MNFPVWNFLFVFGCIQRKKIRINISTFTGVVGDTNKRNGDDDNTNFILFLTIWINTYFCSSQFQLFDDDTYSLIFLLRNFSPLIPLDIQRSPEKDEVCLQAVANNRKTGTGMESKGIKLLCLKKKIEIFCYRKYKNPPCAGYLAPTTK